MTGLETLLVHGVGFGDARLCSRRGSAWVASLPSQELISCSVQGRREGLRETFAADGVTFAPMMYLVPLGELLGGLGVAFGALTIFAVAGLAALNIGALALDGIKRIPSMHPLDPADRLGDLLYLPEVLYVLCLLAVVSFGPGAYSLDALVWR